MVCLRAWKLEPLGIFPQWLKDVLWAGSCAGRVWLFAGVLPTLSGFTQATEQVIQLEMALLPSQVPVKPHSLSGPTVSWAYFYFTT